MKNPAVKSRRPSTSSSSASAAGSIKGRRSSNASSVVSAGSKLSSPAVSSTRSIKIEKREPEEETKMPVPQLKLGPNGEIMLDEKSLVIETTGDKEARETLANADIVYDDEFSGSEFDMGTLILILVYCLYCDFSFGFLQKMQTHS